MSLYYEDCREDAGCGSAFPFDPVQTAEAVIGAVLESEHCPYAADVSLMLVTDDEIRTMNKETRNIDKATDVLSFPMFAYTVPAAFSEPEAYKADAFDPESGHLLLGDIVISADRMAAQAEEYGHSLRREFAFLVAHSALHLIGYDHMTPEEEEVMTAKQEAVLIRLDITREN